MGGLDLLSWQKGIEASGKLPNVAQHRPTMSEPPRRNLGIRLPAALIEAIEARAEATGQTKTTIVEAALCGYLGLAVGTDTPDVMQRLAAVEQRLADVEQRLTVSAQRRPTVPNVATAQPATAPIAGEYRTGGASLSTAEAISASGAPITEAQAHGSNANAAMRRQVGQSVAEWLESQGWVKVGRRWQRMGLSED